MALTVIDPILVDGEDDFGERWKGDGSEANPYRLKEDYEIDASGHEYGIKILDSGKHVEIKDCKIHGASGTDGAGIYMDYADPVKIINNEIYDNDVGIYNKGQAWSHVTTIKGNDITSNETGIYLYNTQEVIVERNDISGNTTGIHGFYNTCDLEILDNNILDNSKNGIELEEYCNSNLIKANKISGNGNNGIYFHYQSGDNEITENIIENNDTGASIGEGSDDNVIWKNEFLSNTVQAYDAGPNEWDLGDPAEGGDGGNYWSDYDGGDRGDGIGDTPYDIDGGDNQDRYPFVVDDLGIYWDEEIETGASIDAVDVGEIQEEIEGIADHVGLEISWEEFGEDGLPAVDDIKSDQAKELRDKTEKMYINRHSSVNTGHDSEVDQGHDADVEGIDDDSYETDYDGPYCSGHDSQVDDGDESDYQEIDNQGYNEGNEGSVLGDYDSSVEDNNHTSYCDGHDSTVESGHDSTYEGTNLEDDRGSNDSGYEGSNYSTYNDGEDGTYLGTDNDTDKTEVQSGDDGSYNGTYESDYDSGYDYNDDGSVT